MICNLLSRLKRRLNRPYTYSDLRVPSFLGKARILLKDYDAVLRGERLPVSDSNKEAYRQRVEQLPEEIEQLMREWGFSDKYFAHDDFEWMRPAEPQPRKEQHEPS